MCNRGAHMQLHRALLGELSRTRISGLNCIQEIQGTIFISNTDSNHKFGGAGDLHLETGRTVKVDLEWILTRQTLPTHPLCSLGHGFKNRGHHGNRRTRFPSRHGHMIHGRANAVCRLCVEETGDAGTETKNGEKLAEQGGEFSAHRGPRKTQRKHDNGALRTK